MNEEETYMGEWPVKPYYKRDLAMGYHSCGSIEPPFCLDTPS